MGAKGPSRFVFRIHLNHRRREDVRSLHRNPQRVGQECRTDPAGLPRSVDSRPREERCREGHPGRQLSPVRQDAHRQSPGCQSEATDHAIVLIGSHIAAGQVFSAMLPDGGLQVFVELRYPLVEPASLVPLTFEGLEPKRLSHAPDLGAGEPPCGEPRWGPPASEAWPEERHCLAPSPPGPESAGAGVPQRFPTSR
jgi:hypothetical protein